MCSHHTQHALSSLSKSGQHKPKNVNLVLANFLKVLTLNVGEGREEEEAANQEKTRPDPEIEKNMNNVRSKSPKFCLWLILFHLYH